MKNIFIGLLLLLITLNCYSQEEKGFIAFSIGACAPFGKTTSKESIYYPIGIHYGFSMSGSFGYEFDMIGVAVQIHRAGLKPDFHEDKLRNWRLESALAGPLINLVRTENKFYFDLRFMAGYAKMQTPVYGKNKLYVTLIEEGDGFAFQAGMVSRFPLSKKLSFLLSTDYYSASIKWEEGIHTFNGPVTAFNVQFGLAGRLWK